MVASAGSAIADAAAGKTVYANQCRKCHGPDGNGNPTIAKMLKVDIKPLSSAVQGKSDADLKKDILNGTGKMKPVKISEAEASDVVAYIRTLK